jgi:hypothetical protein
VIKQTAVLTGERLGTTTHAPQVTVTSANPFLYDVSAMEAAAGVAVVACSQGSVITMLKDFVGLVTVKVFVGVTAFITTTCVPVSAVSNDSNVNVGAVGDETNDMLAPVSVFDVTVYAYVGIQAAAYTLVNGEATIASGA